MDRGTYTGGLPLFPSLRLRCLLGNVDVVVPCRRLSSRRFALSCRLWSRKRWPLWLRRPKLPPLLRTSPVAGAATLLLISTTGFASLSTLLVKLAACHISDTGA